MNFTKNPVILQTESDRHRTPCARQSARCLQRGRQPLLIVATDRISAFDYILATGIPDKGRVLTQLSIFWFDFLRDVTPTHFLTANVDEYPDVLQRFRDQLEGRSMLVEARQNDRDRMRRARLHLRLRLEGVSRARHGVRHQAARRLARERQTARADLHARHQGAIGTRRKRQLRARGLADRSRILRSACAISRWRSIRARRGTPRRKGIIIADTKFEFGFVGDQLVLGDEVLTPDSSRFWPAEIYKPGGAQFSFDKQFVRDYLESIHWNKQPPAPSLPEEVAENTAAKYRQAYQRPHRPRIMNWLDFVLVLILAASVVSRFRRGLSRQIIGLVSVCWRWCWVSGSTARRAHYCYPTSVPVRWLTPVASRWYSAAYWCWVRMVSFVVGQILERNRTLDLRSPLGSGLRPAAWIGICSCNRYGSDGVFARRQAARGDCGLPDGPLCSGCGPRCRGHGATRIEERASGRPTPR